MESLAAEEHGIHGAGRHVWGLGAYRIQAWDIDAVMSPVHEADMRTYAHEENRLDAILAAPLPPWSLFMTVSTTSTMDTKH